LQNKLNPPTQSSNKITAPSSDLNYPKVTKRITDVVEATKSINELAGFHDSLTRTEKNELVNRTVDQSQFTIAIIYDGDWMLTVTEYNFEFKQYEGTTISIVPFDCSHNMDYIYSIVGSKVDESGKISLWLFKNGVLIGYDSSEKPYGNALVAGVCDEPSIVDSIG